MPITGWANGLRPRWHIGCCFLDYDRDGHPDLFVADYVNFDPKEVPTPGANKLCTFYRLPLWHSSTLNTDICMGLY